MSFIRDKVKKYIITPLGIKHLSGPKRPSLNHQDVVVLCLCRDEEELLPGFLDHYRNLGTKWFVFVDNGSADSTREIISKQHDCSLFFTKLSFRKFKLYIKRYMFKSFASECWSLQVDADEFFDYPHSDLIPMEDLTSYLEKHGYNCVNATMLDMFSAKPLKESSSITGRKFTRNTYPYFDLENVTCTPLIDNLHPTNKLSNHKLNHCKGGIRSAIFGTNNTLTKHPMIRNKNGHPFFRNSHMPRKAHIADFTTVLFHYKFIASFMEKAFKYAQEENYAKYSYEYKLYRDALDSDNQLTLSTPGMEKYIDLKQLMEKGFLLVSDQYRDELLVKKGRLPQ